MKKVHLIIVPILLCLNIVSFAQNQTVTLTTTGQGVSLQQATDNALRSAIEQTFGAFISTRTEILNDELVSDQIASVSSGNIQSYQVLAQTQLSETLWGVTVNAVVSVTKLTSFVQARGVQVEIQGGLFAANIRQQVLNEEAEIEAIRNMVGVLHELFQTAFDYKIEVGNPTATDATNSNWKIPLKITAFANKNMALGATYFKSTLEALNLTTTQAKEYRSLNKKVFSISAYNLRREESTIMIIALINNLQEAYARLFEIDSGFDQKTGTDPNFISGTQLYKFNPKEKRFVHFPYVGQDAAIFMYDDRRTLEEISKLTGYNIKPLGVVSRVKIASDVYNPKTGKTWMDRNLGALWPAVRPADAGSYGEYYTFDQARTACPTGYRLPTESEWVAERQSWSSNSSTGAFSSPLKLPMAGFRFYSDGSLYSVGSFGYYWSRSRSVNGSLAQDLRFGSTNTYEIYNYRARGGSVRCLKD